jgi:ribonuclease BN (tRNA processing enzyme)
LLEQLDELLEVQTIEHLRSPLLSAFDVRPLDLDACPTAEIGGGVVLTATPVRHAVASAALTFHDGDRAVAFSSDTGPTPVLAQAAAGADLFVCEATYGTSERGAEPDEHGHLSAAQAATAAAEAGAARLLLTHFSDPRSAAPSAAIAGEHFDGPVVAARRGHTESLAPLSRRWPATRAR